MTGGAALVLALAGLLLGGQPGVIGIVLGRMGVQFEFDIDLRKVPLKAFQAYLSEHLNLVLVKGEAATKGHFSLRQAASDEAKITFTGKAALENLKTVDGRHAADILHLRRLSLTGISYRNQPPAFSLQKIAGKGLQVNFVKESDGRSNFAMMLVAKEVEPSTPISAAIYSFII